MHRCVVQQSLRFDLDKMRLTWLSLLVWAIRRAIHAVKTFQARNLLVQHFCHVSVPGWFAAFVRRRSLDLLATFEEAGSWLRYLAGIAGSGCRARLGIRVLRSEIKSVRS